MFAEFVVALDEVTQTVQQLLGYSEHLLLVLGLLVLHPGNVYHVQDSQQVLLASNKHLVLEGVAPQRGVVGQRQLQ